MTQTVSIKYMRPKKKLFDIDIRLFDLIMLIDRNDVLTAEKNRIQHLNI